MATPLGVTQAALEHVLRLAPKRGITYSTYTAQTESPAFQIKVAEAAVRFTSARTLTAELVREVDQAAAQKVSHRAAAGALESPVTTAAPWVSSVAGPLRPNGTAETGAVPAFTAP